MHTSIAVNSLLNSCLYPKLARRSSSAREIAAFAVGAVSDMSGDSLRRVQSSTEKTRVGEEKRDGPPSARSENRGVRRVTS